MARAFDLEVVTPERIVFRGPVESLVVPAWEGYLGVLAGHSPLLCMLRAGELRVTAGGNVRRFAVSGGYLEAVPSRAVVLADAVEEAHEIDVERARRALERARDPERRRKHPEEAARAEERARARLRVAGQAP